MREMGVLEARTKFSALLEAVEDGERVTITRHGRPIAELVPIMQQRPVAKPASGQELAASFKALQDKIAAAHPETEALTWEALKAMART